MNSRIRYLLLLCIPAILLINNTFAQGNLKGVLYSEEGHAPVPFANIIIENTTTGTTSDIDGKFEIRDIKPGFHRIVISSIGFETKVSQDILITRDKPAFIEVLLKPTAALLQEVEISGPQFVKKEESPVSLQTIGIREIERSPGSNRDISKVIQSLPGVASTPSFRNDIIIRGGSPSENKFYLDGVEIPVINHFQTQGSTGGPVGIINVNFIREVDFYSSAFPASRGNALSSVMEFKQIDGNPDKNALRFTLGSSEAGLTMDGPLGPKTNYILSVRRSYLKFLFSVFKLPFLPTFTDAQFKIKHRFDEKNELTILGIGGYDQFELNKSVNDNVTDSEQLELNNYILGNIPTNTQWNYTTGAVFKHYGNKNTTTLVLSRNELNNESDKYVNNDESDAANKLLDYNSKEIENKFRFENLRTVNGFRINAGAGLEYVNYSVNGFDNRETPYGPLLIRFKSDLNFIKYGLFASVSKPVIQNRLVLSAGLRSDANSYSSAMNNPADQISVRLAASYSITEKLSFNFNTGNYYQLPAYTILGYGDASGELVNKKNNVTYIRSDHVVAGFQYNPDLSSKITLEGFYKKYSKYPFSLTDSISLANLGSDFGVIGNEAVTSTSNGRAYGLELLLQRRSSTGIFGIAAFTLVRSEFTGYTNAYIPSSWDNKFLLTLTGGKELGKNWDIGLKWRYVTGRPYTPYDTLASSLKSNWDVSGQGQPDYSKLNTLRVAAFHQLDIRIDKSWYLNKWSLNLYLDIQNLYNFKAKEPDILNVRTDTNGNPVTDPNDSTRYEVYFIKNQSGTVLPTIGIILDF